MHKFPPVRLVTWAPRKTLALLGRINVPSRLLMRYFPENPILKGFAKLNSAFHRLLFGSDYDKERQATWAARRAPHREEAAQRKHDKEARNLAKETGQAVRRSRERDGRETTADDRAAGRAPVVTDPQTIPRRQVPAQPVAAATATRTPAAAIDRGGLV